MKICEYGYPATCPNKAEFEIPSFEKYPCNQFSCKQHILFLLPTPKIYPHEVWVLNEYGHRIRDWTMQEYTLLYNELRSQYENRNTTL